MSLHKKTWLITKSQIGCGDIDSAILPVDPEQVPDAEIYGLHGIIRLRVEGVKGPIDLFGNPVARKYFQELHKRWPYAGYFLRLCPVTLESPQQQIIDLSMFMALALCHCNHLKYCESKHGIGLQFETSELATILAELQVRAAELADAIGIPTKEIERRDDLISRSVASFFDAGKANFPQQNNINQRKNLR
jgi:hypothetical protein